MRYERTLGDPPPAENQPLAEGLRGGSVVLMVAAFEAFLRDAFEERMQGLGAAITPAKFDRLPDRVKTNAVYNLLNEAMDGAPGKPVAELKVDRLPDILSAAGAVASKTVLGTAFSTTGSNPNVDTVKRLFTQADYSNIFEKVHGRFQRLWRHPVAKDYPARQLTFIVDTRHEIAHGGSVLTWTRDDLQEALRHLRILGQALDEELRIHVNRLARS
jgi:hypothetical protein